MDPSVRVVVRSIEPGSPLERVGIEPGDGLIAWSRGPRGAEILAFDDLWEIEIEESLRGPIGLTVARSGRRFEVQVPAGRWRLETQPAMDPALQRETDRLLSAPLVDRSPKARREQLERIRSKLGPNDASRAGLWLQWQWTLLEEAAEPAEEEGEEDGWAETLHEALRLQDPGLEAWLWRERCLQLERQGALRPARSACAESASHRESIGQGLLAAEARYRRARVTGRLGDPRAEEAEYREVLTRLEGLAPNSLLTVRALHGLAKSRATQDDLQEAFRLGQRSLALAEAQAPGGLDHQASEMILGIFHWFSSEWGQAELRIGRSLEILQGIDSNHPDVANALNNLGIVASARGDLVAAEDYYRRSLEIRARVAPDPLESSRTLTNLSSLALVRGDVEGSIRYEREILALRRDLAPGSIDVATPLLNLGTSLVEVGEWDEAEAVLAEALALQRRHIPGTRDVCNTLASIGRLQQVRGELEPAKASLTEAVSLCARQAPRTVLEARVQMDLARVLVDLGDTATAEPLARRATSTSGTLVPATTTHALGLHVLGQALYRQGRLEEALVVWRGAAHTLDRQLSSLGGGDAAESQFRASWRHIDRDLAALLLELGQPEAAFEALEKARARSFLSWVLSRGGETTRVDQDLAESWSQTQAAYDTLQAEIARQLADRRSAAVEDLVEARRELEHRREDLTRRIRERSPRRDELETAFDVQRARKALGDTVAAVSYSVDHTGVRVWVLAPGRPLRVENLSISPARLRDLVDRFRLLVGHPESVGSGHFEVLSRRLYDLLLAPVASDLDSVERLVVVPDGALHHLPFAALQRRHGADGTFLVEWKPFQVNSSVTAWARLQGRAAERGSMVAAFADPTLEASRVAPEVDDLVRLPAARGEAETLQGLYGDQVRVWLGEAATEAAVKRVGAETNVLHFATHAWVDSKSPLDSALLLVPSDDAVAGRNNGLLQAWEIVQDLHLETALVTLSACESGSGPVVGDEGIVGLTRAFQFAGARGVVASLWRVADGATGQLMEHFYRELRAGLPVDEALRQAQLRVIRQPPRKEGFSLARFLADPFGPAATGTSHPYYWSGFQLFGAAGPNPL